MEDDRMKARVTQHHLKRRTSGRIPSLDASDFFPELFEHEASPISGGVIRRGVKSGC
jgi:hypothetical protein